MTLAKRLKSIADEKNNLNREQKIQDFEERINGHLEEKLLRACLEAARYGKTYISFERSCVPPEQLEPEGFFLKNNGSGYLYCWS